MAILPVADSRLRSVQGRTHRSVALVVVVYELLEVGEFFEGRTRDLAWMPDLRAFMEETALPVTEVGPVDFCALRRLASI